MNIGFTLFYVMFFFVTFLIRNRIRTKTLDAEKIRGRIVGEWTTKYILFVYLIILIGSFFEYFVVKREINYFLSFSGLTLYCAGLLGRQWSFNSLGRYWSVDIEIRDNHEIIRKGPYKYIRHPNSLFHLFEVIGITMIPNSHYSAVFAAVFYIPVIILRSLIEERAMSEHLKDKYEVYKKETWGYLPLF